MAGAPSLQPEISATSRLSTRPLRPPGGGYFEYSAIVTNKEVTGRTLWSFMCGRGTHEKVCIELKGGFAFDCLPMQRYHANSVWQEFITSTFNYLMRAMQAGTTERRSTNHRRRPIRPFQTIQTLRWGFINRARLLVQPGARQILNVGINPMVRERCKTIESALAA